MELSASLQQKRALLFVRLKIEGYSGGSTIKFDATKDQEPTPKAEPNVTTATDYLPAVQLGDFGSEWSMEVKVRKAKGGIEFRPANSKKQGKRIGWRALAEKFKS